MAATIQTNERAAVATLRAEKSAALSRILSLHMPWGALAAALTGILLVFGLYRWYQQSASFTHGMDYFSPDFKTYWMNLLYAQLAIIGAAGVGSIGYLWATRDRHLERLAPMEELRRYVFLLAQLLGTVIIGYIVLSVYAESDATWHQITVRDTDFTPTHIALFYFGVPMTILFSAFHFMYARTRLPEFAARLSVPHALIVAGPILIMPNIGFNEWGHTFFYAEELFAAPIHWGFVVLGWAFFAAGGLLVQIFLRMTELVRGMEAASLPA
jgi:methane/ammonia monooxygenase subunit C